ncbi:MAG: hypothetical protein ACXW2O_06030, partial [Candidatus Aminicenantales bacterium]
MPFRTGLRHRGLLVNIGNLDFLIIRTTAFCQRRIQMLMRIGKMTVVIPFQRSSCWMAKAVSL